MEIVKTYICFDPIGICPIFFKIHVLGYGTYIREDTGGILTRIKSKEFIELLRASGIKFDEYIKSDNIEY